MIGRNRFSAIPGETYETGGLAPDLEAGLQWAPLNGFAREKEIRAHGDGGGIVEFDGCIHRQHEQIDGVDCGRETINNLGVGTTLIEGLQLLLVERSHDVTPGVGCGPAVPDQNLQDQDFERAIS